MFHMSHVDSRR